MADIQHIWCCSCGVETPCTFDDMKIGGYFQCPACGESAVGVVSKSGRKEFVKLDRQHVTFLRLFDPPEPDEDVTDTLMLLEEAIRMMRNEGVAGQHIGAACSARDLIRERLTKEGE